MRFSGKSNQKGNITIWIGLIIVFLLTIGGVYYFEVMINKPKPAQTLTFPTPTNSPQNLSVPTYSPTPTPKPLPQVKTGFQQYTDDNLKYGFNYPNNLALTKCRDIPCLSIGKDKLFVRIEPLDAPYSTINPKVDLLTTDLYCNADGMGGGIHCQNTKVEDYTNSLGFKGFKVYRTKTVTGNGAGIFKDIAYVFYFPKEYKDGNMTWIGVLFATDATDSSLSANQSQLDQIADSYFAF